MTIVPVSAASSSSRSGRSATPKTAAKAPTKRTPTRKASPKAAKKTPAKKPPARKRTSTAKATTAAAPRARKATVSPAAGAGATTASPPESAPQISRAWPNAPVRRGLGVALLGLAGAGKFTAGAAPVVGPGSELPAEPVMDVTLGAVDVALEWGERMADGARRYVNPVLSRAWAGAATPMGGTAGAGLRFLGALTEPLAVRGRRLRADAEHEAAAAVASVLPETIQLVMERLDLTELAIDHVDIQRVLEATADQVDLTGFAIDHMDLVRLIEASLDQVDFTGLAITRLDFARAVTAAMEQVDVMTVAREQMDPARVAQYLRENVDVAEALRQAPTAVAGEAVRGVRQTVGRITGRR